MNRNPITLDSSLEDANVTYPDNAMLRALNAHIRDVDYNSARLAMALIADSPNAKRNRRRRATMDRIARDDAAARYERGRRTSARQNGYRGPLTRAEASRQQLARLAARS